MEAMDPDPPRQSQLDDGYRLMLDQLGLDVADYPLHWSATHDGGPHLEADGEGWALIVTDRGQEVSRSFYSDQHQLLFRLACNIVAAAGGRYQAANQSDGRDPRRADFARRLDLIGRVSPQWQQRLGEELAQWLARHPYRDLHHK